VGEDDTEMGFSKSQTLKAGGKEEYIRLNRLNRFVG
jgi:hypothetical protein